ncbi:MAG: glycoside hydrolase family 2 TIM barrel-domain containing protein, partial [Clostridia bacterium]|nr:glycoside hydrolase family 2 TIM barrel-domain containing protein [Clostridia bacterium]
MKRRFLAYIRDPAVFAVNRLEAHADHTVLGADGAPAPVQPLDGEWELAFYERPEDIDEALLVSGEAEARVRVPGHLPLQGFGRPQYTNVAYPWDGREALRPPEIPRENPTGLYIRRFLLPELPADRRAVLCLEGAEPCCFVTLNGSFAGYAEDSFTPSEFDITDFLLPGENRLCVLVPRFATASWLEDQDFWRFFGLFRSVYIRFEESLHIRDLALRPLLDEGLENGRLELTLSLEARRDAGAARIELSCAGAELSAPLSLAAGRQELAFSLPVARPRLWSAETPHLYELRAVITDAAGGFLAGASAFAGFRHFACRDGLLRLNGRRIVFRGVNRHEWSCANGRAVTPEEIEEDIRLLKRNNFNAVRTSHYPNQSLFYALADRYGLYVIDETNLETHGTWMLKSLGLPGQTPLPDDRPEWREAVLDRGRSMLERDKNHPCVLFWSCGNESYGGRTLCELAAYFRARDPLRLVHYEGISRDRRYPDTSDVESRMYAKPRQVERYVRRGPKKPFLLCEYAHAMGNSFGNVAEYVALEDRYPAYQGGFIWDWIDQALLLPGAGGGLAAGGDFLDRPNDRYFCGDGLLFADRSPSPKLMEAKALYAPLRIRPERGGIAVENRQIFSGTEGLRFRWTRLSDGLPDAEGDFLLALGPGETGFYPLTLPEGPGESILRCEARLAEDRLWAEAGHVLAAGEAVLHSAPASAPADRPARLFTGMANIGAHMKNSRAIIDRRSGLIVSLEGACEFMLAPLLPDFWRAPTDNDLGCGAPLRWGKWKLASLYRRSLPALTDAKKGRVTVFCRSGPVRYRLDYRFYEDDALDIRIRLYPLRGDAPRFGFQLTLPPAFDRFDFYGNSAPEAAVDRRSALRIERGEGRVSEQYVPYLNPQDCANRTDLRWLRLSDGAGHALRLSADVPFEASVLPWTSHELENAPS